MMKIISLTAIPSRFERLGPTLESLLAQGADQVRLNIPVSYNRFPEWDGTLPAVPAGVSVVRCGQDFGPATKVLPTSWNLRGEDAQILFCDDDCIVSANWANRLFKVQARRPEEAVAAYVRPSYLQQEQEQEHGGRRAWEVPVGYDVPFRFSRLKNKLLKSPVAYRRPFWIPGYGDVFFGVGGVVVRPDFFDDVAFDIPDVAWRVDDIWLSAMLARKGIRIYCPWLSALPKAQVASQQDALLDDVAVGMGRQELNLAASKYCREFFGVW